MSWLEKLSVESDVGEITNIDAATLMCPLTTRLEEYGKISQKVFRMGGAEFAAQLKEVRDDLPDKSLLLGESVSLELKPDCRIGKFQHVILTALWATESEYTRNLFYKSYMTAIRATMTLGLKSIVVPAMGYDSNLTVSSAALLAVIQDLETLKNSQDFSLEQIHIVSTNPNHVDYLRSHVDAAIYR